MDIKKTYSYYLKENLKTTGIIYLIVLGVTFLLFLFALFIGESFSLSSLSGLIPNFFTVSIVSFIFSIVSSKTIDLTCNQFGKSRKTAFVSNLLVSFTIAFIVAAVLSSLLNIFYNSEALEYAKISAQLNNRFLENKGLIIGTDLRYVSRFSFWIYNFAYYAFISIWATSFGVFIYSLWVRLEKLYRWIVFLFVPMVLAYTIPKIVISIFMNGYDTMRLANRLISFFGLENGCSFRFMFISILIFILPILIIAYFVMLKKPLYGKKK